MHEERKEKKMDMNCRVAGCAHKNMQISLEICTLCYLTVKICFSWEADAENASEGREEKIVKRRFVAIESGDSGDGSGDSNGTQREGECSQRENCNENANSVHGRKCTASERMGWRKGGREREKNESNVRTTPTTTEFIFFKTK